MLAFSAPVRTLAWATWLTRLLPPLCIGAGIAAQFTSPGLSTPVAAISIVFPAAGVVMSRRQTMDRWNQRAMLVLITAAVLGVPGAMLWGGGEIAQSAIIALLTIPAIALYWASPWKLLRWGFLALALAEAGAIFHDAWRHPLQRADGFTTDQTAAAGLMVLAAVAVLPTKHRWLALLFMAALLPTGSRWATLIMAAMLLGMTVAKKVPWRVTIAMVIGVAIVGFTMRQTMPNAFRTLPVAENTAADAASRTAGAVFLRLQCPGGIALLPHGWMNDADQAGRCHSVPMRLVYESGVIAMFAWGLVTGRSLWQRPRWTEAHLLMITMAAFAVFYYWAWAGPLGGIWAMLVAQREQEAA